MTDKQLAESFASFQQQATQLGVTKAQIDMGLTERRLLAAREGGAGGADDVNAIAAPVRVIAELAGCLKQAGLGDVLAFAGNGGNIAPVADLSVRWSRRIYGGQLSTTRGRRPAA